MRSRRRARFADCPKQGLTRRSLLKGSAALAGGAAVGGFPTVWAQDTAGIVLNQTGQAVEVLLITMGVYLTISILTSMFMNWYNARMALVER